MTNQAELLEMLADRGGIVCEPADVPAILEACRAAGLTTAHWPVGPYVKVVLTTED